jgi:Flp pilus assembly protein protease CpaA
MSQLILTEPSLFQLSRRESGWLFGLAPLVGGPLWVSVAAAVTGPQLGTFAGYLLVQLLGVVVIADVRGRIIPNWATYPCFAWGLGINALPLVWPSAGGSWLGAVGMGPSLAGGFGLLVVMLAIFSVSGGGAGDVKLAACLGALLGWQQGVDALLYSSIVGGACVLAYSIWTHGLLFLVRALVRQVGSTLLPGLVQRPQAEQRHLLLKRLPLAPFFAAGTLLAVYQDVWLPLLS